MAAAANTDETKVMILCGVLGVGCVIGVEIAHHATVASLRETISNQEGFNNQYKFAASDWTLFMAQDPHLSDARLQWDVDLKPFLMHGRVSDSGFKQMDLTWRLDDDNAFDDEPPLADLHDQAGPLVFDHSVLVLLTNLVDDWRFLWFDSKRKHYYIRVCLLQVTTPSEGFAFIKDWLTQTSFHDGSEFTVPYMSQPVKRRKLDVLLPWIRDDKHGGGNGIRESLEQYFDIADVMGPDVEMARAVAKRMVASIPGYPGDE